MTWLRVDDVVADHPAVLAVGDAAFGAAVRLAAYSARHLTDGHIPATAARMMASQETLDVLTAGGLLATDGDGWRLVDLLHVRPKADVERDRAAAAARKVEWRQRQEKAEQKKARRRERRRNGVPDDGTNGVRSPSQTRPVPEPVPDPEGCIQSASAGAREGGPEPDRAKALWSALAEHGISESHMSATNVSQLWDLVVEHARAAGLEPAAVAFKAVEAFASIAAGWTAPKPPLPHLLMKHWTEVQAALSGRAPTPRAKRADRGRIPVVQFPNLGKRGVGSEKEPVDDGGDGAERAALLAGAR